MAERSWREAAGVLLICALLILLPGAATAAPASYRVINLGTLGGTSSYGIAMNDRDALVGRAQTADETYHGFLWRDGQMTNLGKFTPIDINNSEQIVGTRDDVGGAWIWHDGRFTSLTGLAYPRAINDSGRVVGGRDRPDGFPTPALWSDGEVAVLPLLDAPDLNGRVQVAGTRTPDDTQVGAAVWTAGRVTDLPSAGRGGAFRINDHGWVIGWVADEQGNERASLWRGRQRTDLGDLGGSWSHAMAINNRGQVLLLAGRADGNYRPALWDNGKLTDLTALGIPGDADYADLDDRGRILGSERVADGVAHAMLWQR
ncbi:hypothetical protein GCM10009616_37950 [Microlunatus lacustris]